MLRLHTPYYSHPATRQDEWVVEKTDCRQGGLFVEVGAHDGIRHSNTFALEESLGWNGLLIEPDPQLFQRLMASRRRCKAIRCAIGDTTADDVPFVFGDAYGGLWEHMPDDWKAEHQVRRSPVGVVSMIPLVTALQKASMPKVIDYLSLDVEGAEYPILYSYFRHHGAPHTFRMMTVEFRYDQILLTKLTDLLELEGYYLDEVRGFDACFIHSELGA